MQPKIDEVTTESLVEGLQESDSHLETKEAQVSPASVQWNRRSHRMPRVPDPYEPHVALLFAALTYRSSLYQAKESGDARKWYAMDV